MTKSWPAPAKVNLFLYINGRRSDGYHTLQTLFQFLDYSDIISITPTVGGRIRLLKPIENILEHNNLILQAAQLLQLHCWGPNHLSMPGVDLKIKKILPIGGGLGGGSSNAATVLIALNFHWKCGLTISTLSKIGMTLGADVPVFIHGKSVFAEGIGDLFTPAAPIEKWYLIAVPPISIITSNIFNDPELQRNTLPRSFDELMNIPFQNDCESVVKKRFPEVKRYFSWLLKYAPARLTGTGACLFAEFDDEASAHNVLLQAPAWMRAFVAKGINISPLHRVLSKIS